jgi:hypothetical protein
VADIDPHDGPTFDYVFDNEFNVIEVKGITSNRILYANIPPKLHPEEFRRPSYLEELKKQVEYWDGQKWMKSSTRVRR